jgi:hypothetical protein
MQKRPPIVYLQRNKELKQCLDDSRPVFEKSSTPKFDIDDVIFLKKIGRLSFKIINF